MFYVLTTWFSGDTVKKRWGMVLKVIVVKRQFPLSIY